MSLSFQGVARSVLVACCCLAAAALPTALAEASDLSPDPAREGAAFAAEPRSTRTGEIEALLALRRVGGVFALEEEVLLGKYEIQGRLSALEADVLLSRALYDRLVACVPLTKDQEDLLSGYRASVETRGPDLADLQARALAGRREHWGPDPCDGTKAILVGGPSPAIASITAEGIPDGGPAASGAPARSRAERSGQGYAREVEPNGSAATATPIVGTNLVLRGNLYPNGDIDWYSFAASAGDRVYAAAMTSGSAGSSTDAQLTIYAGDGTTVIEFDDDNGSFAGLSPSIAGSPLPVSDTYFIKVNDFTAGTTSERPYELHFQLQSGSPTPEVESNDTPATANPLPANGWVSGTRNPAAATEQDWYSFTANAGDTVFLSLDLNPERDGVVWNGRLGIALFGDASNQILPVDDAGTGDVSPVPNNPSEALFMTVKNAGTYFAFVDSASAAVGGPAATYTLSVSIHPATDEGVNCTTYTSTDVPKTIGPGTGLVSSTLTVPGNPRIADLDVDIVLNHALMQDVDAHLRSPAGNDDGLFTDIGAAATGGQMQMDLVFDDEAGVPPSFTALKGVQLKPENNSTAGTASTSGAYRLSWFDGENAGGTWTLDLRDDTAGANGGTLTAWSLRICEEPPPPACPPGFVRTTVFSTDFESGAAGFTHSGAQDEWELGLPATVATTTANPVAGFSTCNSGVSCWKTDLDNTYNASCNQDLLSPNIDLAGLSAPVVVTWAQRHQVETATFDRMFVDYQQVGGATPVRLYEWLEPTPISASAGTGNPQANIGGSAGWGVFSRRADSLAGLNTELRFHLDSDTTVQFGGLAIDDVSVCACLPASADLAITKTDGVAAAVPGGSVTYTITASNAGPDPVTGATVADTFPAVLTGTWTCVGAGGGTCTAAGSGNISDTVNLPAGGSVTYTVTAAVSSSATGTLSNTATVAAGGGVVDPAPANNSATDTDTLVPQADLSVTKSDAPDPAVAGQNITYSLTVNNAGPSDAALVTLADAVPANTTFSSFTAPGGWAASTPAAGGTGNVTATIASLAPGGPYTFTLVVHVGAAVPGGTTIDNTATVASATTDPNSGNNSAAAATTVPCPTITVSNPAVMTGSAGVPFSQSFTQMGGAAPVTFSTASALPAGLSLAGDGTLSGTPAVTGTFPIAVTATDADGCTGTGPAYTLVISCPAITLAALANGTVGTPYGSSAAASPAGTYTYAVTLGSLPPGLSLDAATGAVTGTPTANGTNNFTITATGWGTCTGSQAYTLVIACPAITLAALANGTVGTAYGSSAAASPGGTYTYAVTLGSLPPGLSLDAATGAVTGTPTAGGSTAFTITATGWGSCTGSRDYTVAIACPGITLSPPVLPGSYVGMPYSQTLTADPPGGSYAFAVSAGTLPPGLGLSPGGLLSGTPSAAGTYSFTVTAAGWGICTGSRTYSVRITCPPIVLSPEPTALPPGQVGSAYGFTLAAAGGTAPYTFAVVLNAPPPGLALAPAGLIAGTPTAAGNFGFTVQARDAYGCTATKYYEIQIHAACAPIAVSPATLPGGKVSAAYSKTVSATGGAAPYTFTVTSGLLPPGLTLNAATGLLAGRPTVAGSFPFTVTATDAHLCAGSRSYTIAVCSTIALSPASPLAAGKRGVACSRQITASGGIGPYAFSVAAGLLPPGLTLSSGGLISGTPLYAGTYSFTAKAVDSIGCAGTRAYTLMINP